MSRQQRFRASIYVDIYIEEYSHDGEYVKSLEEMREEAREKVQAIVNEVCNTENKNIPDGLINPYVGDVAKYTPTNLLQPFDREI